MTLSEAFLTLRDECLTSGCARHPQAVQVVYANVLKHANCCVRRFRSGVEPSDIAQRVWQNQLLKQDADGSPCMGIRRLCKRNETDAQFSYGVRFYVLTEHGTLVDERWREQPSGGPVEPGPGPITGPGSDPDPEMVEAALRAFRLLRPVEQRLIEKRYVLGMTLEEIARSEGKSIGWVHSRIARARSRYRILFEAEWDRG